jgi:hypothetical protein
MAVSIDTNQFIFVEVEEDCPKAMVHRMISHPSLLQGLLALSQPAGCCKAASWKTDLAVMQAPHRGHSKPCSSLTADPRAPNCSNKISRSIKSPLILAYDHLQFLYANSNSLQLTKGFIRTLQYVESNATAAPATEQRAAAAL